MAHGLTTLPILCPITHQPPGYNVCIFAYGQTGSGGSPGAPIRVRSRSQVGLLACRQPCLLLTGTPWLPH